MKFVGVKLFILSFPFLFCFCSKEDNKSLLYHDTSTNVGSISNQRVLSVNCKGFNFDIIEYTVLSQIDGLKPVFRIPSVIVTNNGTVIVACENRAIFDDKDEIDILVSRKEENESNWTIKRVFVSDSCGRSMNPVFVVDRDGSQGKKGRIFLFVCHIKGDKYDIDTEREKVDFVYKYSDDDGVSWSQEYSLKNRWKTNNYTSIIPSPCNGIQMKDGVFLIPTMVIKNGTYRAGILVKKPLEDWYFSSLSHVDGDNECTIYIDNDDNIILDCRTLEKMRRRYVYNIERDDFTLLSNHSVSVDLKAEIHKMDQDKSIYLMSFVDTNRDVRENLTLYASTDAINWKKVYRMQEGTLPLLISAYSNPYSWGEQVFVAYETGYEIKVQDISQINDYIQSLLYK